MRKILVIAAIVGLGTSAFAKGGGAGVYLGLGLGQQTASGTAKVAGASADIKGDPGMIYGLDLGYMMASGLYLGLAYETGSSSDSSSGTKVTSTLTNTGLGVGWMHNGFQVIGRYILSSSNTDDSAAKSKLTGTGFGVKLGYAWMLGQTFGLGLFYDYASLSYNKYETNGAEVPDATASVTTSTPGILLTFQF